MKTPMQELIEVLKIHRDTAFEKAEHFKSHDVEGMYQWYDYRGQTLNDAISFAELQLEKEKEVMESAWQDGMYECDGDGTFEDFYKTFKTKDNGKLD